MKKGDGRRGWVGAGQGKVTKEEVSVRGTEVGRERMGCCKKNIHQIQKLYVFKKTQSG